MYEHKVALEKHTKHPGTHSKLSVQKQENVDLEDSLNELSAMKGGGPSVIVITEENKAEEDIATDRLKELMSDLLQMRKFIYQVFERFQLIASNIWEILLMRKRLKKEEENRRQFQEIARKKDEELKRMKIEMQNMEKRVAEEESLKMREKNLVQQRDNRIRLIEDKVKELKNENELLKFKMQEQSQNHSSDIGGGERLIPVKANSHSEPEKQPRKQQPLQKNDKQKEVKQQQHKVIKVKEDADKHLVEQLEKDPASRKQDPKQKKQPQPIQQKPQEKKSVRIRDEMLPDEEDYDQFGNDDDDNHRIKNQYGDEEDEEMELRPVKPGKTFLFGAVDNLQ